MFEKKGKWGNYSWRNSLNFLHLICKSRGREKRGRTRLITKAFFGIFTYATWRTFSLFLPFFRILPLLNLCEGKRLKVHRLIICLHWVNEKKNCRIKVEMGWESQLIIYTKSLSIKLLCFRVKFMILFVYALHTYQGERRRKIFW